MTLFSRLDRRWWLIVIVVCGALLVLFWLTSTPNFSYFGNLGSAQRASLYSALAGVCSGLLGFSLAAIAVLISVPKNPSRAFTVARTQTVSLLLSTCVLLGMALTLSILGMIVD